MAIASETFAIAPETATTTTVSPGSIADLGTVLSVWAHPDDETYLAGGLMAAARDAGQRVVCVSATAGELGTDDADRWPPERLGPLRAWEATAAMAVLGVSQHQLLGLPDGGLRQIPLDDGVTRMGELIAAVEPDTILTFGPDGMTFHPDHITVSMWMTTAWQRAGRPGRLFHAVMSTDHVERFGHLYRQWNVMMTDDEVNGRADDEIALRVTVGGVALDRKVAALAAMASQTRGVIELFGPELFAENVAEECFVEVL